MADGKRTNYAELIRAVGEAERVAQVDVRRILDATFRIMNERTGAGGEVVIGRLGTFRGSIKDTVFRLSFRRSSAGSRQRKFVADTEE